MTISCTEFPWISTPPQRRKYRRYELNYGSHCKASAKFSETVKLTNELESLLTDKIPIRNLKTLHSTPKFCIKATLCAVIVDNVSNDSSNQLQSSPTPVAANSRTNWRQLLQIAARSMRRKNSIESAFHNRDETWVFMAAATAFNIFIRQLFSTAFCLCHQSMPA